MDGILQTADDGQFQRSFRTTVLATNDVPTLDAIPNPTAIPEDSGSQSLVLSGVSAGSNEVQELVVTARSSGHDVIPDPTVTRSGNTWSLNYTPVANASGTATISVTVRDAGSDGVSGTDDDASVTRSFDVVVQPVNDAPVIAVNTAQDEFQENGAAQDVVVNIGDVDDDVSQLVLTASSSNPTLFPNSLVEVIGTGANRSVRLRPASGQAGQAIISLAVRDVAGLSATTTFDVVVHPSPLVDFDIPLDGADSILVRRVNEAVEVLINNTIAPQYAAAASSLRSLHISGSSGNNRIDLSGVSVSAFPALLTVQASGGDGNDTLIGSEFADSLLGNAGLDVIQGGAGNDTLDGGAGNDSLDGGRHNDVLTGGLGADTLVGGTEIDVLKESFDVNMILTTTTFTTSFTGQTTVRDTLNGIEGADLSGGSLANTINASAFVPAANLVVTLTGGGGADNITGTTGPDLIVANGAVGVTISSGNGNDTLITGAGRDSINAGAGADSIIANDGNDSVVGGTGADFIDGGNGDDVLNGQADDDFILGGAGNDSLLGESGNDQLRGDVGNDTLNASTGNDSLYGQDGDDQLIAGDGADLLDGDIGNDMLRGDNGNDTLIGALGNDSLLGGANNDSLDGGDGHDDVRGDGGLDTVLGQAGNDTLYGGADADIIWGDVGDDVLRGDGGNDTLHGELGNDSLFGGSDNDQMNGGNGGNDLLNGESGADTIAEIGDTDVVVTGTNYASPLFGTRTTLNVERLVFVGGASDNRFDARAATVAVQFYGLGGNDTLLGGSKADSLYAGDGDDVLSGGVGNDSLDGGAGIDALYESANTNFTLSVTRLVSSLLGTDSLANLEQAVLSGGVGNNRLDASTSNLSVTLIGGDGNDTLIGGALADVLIGGSRSDTSLGRDSLIGNGGADRFDADAADIRVTDASDLILAQVLAALPQWIDSI